MDYEAFYRKGQSDYFKYYQKLAEVQTAHPTRVARTRVAAEAMPGEAQKLLAGLPEEIKNSSLEYGAPIPPLLEGCTVVDLGCGSGRDAYLLAQLVGSSGKVIAVDPNEDHLEIARKHLSDEMARYGYSTPNIEFVNAVPEDLSFLPDTSVDVVVSNCNFNMSPDKGAYIREVKRVLKPQGEWYFTDIYTDRRIPQVVSDDVERVAERLGGAMFIEDFRRVAQSNGFHDPRYVITTKTPITEEEQANYPDIAFATITSRLINSGLTSDHCEDYGEEIIYDGSLTDYPDYFLFDKDIKFPVNQPCHVCDNVSVLGLDGCRYSKVIKVKGDRSVHYGDIHGDQIIKTAL